MIGHSYLGCICLSTNQRKETTDAGYYIINRKERPLWPTTLPSILGKSPATHWDVLRAHVRLPFPYLSHPFRQMTGSLWSGTTESYVEALFLAQGWARSGNLILIKLDKYVP